MKIIDAQVHIWSQTVTPPTGKHRKVPRITAEEMLAEMDAAERFDMLSRKDSPLNTGELGVF